MKVLKFIVVLSVLGWSQSYGQVSNRAISECVKEDPNMAYLTPTSSPNGSSLFGGKSLAGNFRDLAEIKGNPYFLSGVSAVFKMNNTQVKNNSFRYNLYTNQFEMLSNGQKDFLAGELVAAFESNTVDGDTRKFINTSRFVSNGFVDDGFFEVLFDGKTKLYAFEKVDVKESSYSEDAPATYEYKRKSSYYLMLNDQLVELHSFNKKGLSVFGNKSVEVRSFVKQNKLKMKQQEDITKVVAFYASLQ